MKWIFKSRVLINKLVLAVSAIMGIVLLTKSNFVGAIGLYECEEIRYFIESTFAGHIQRNHNLFFVVLILAGTLLLLLGRKDFNAGKIDGIWLNNMGIGYLATTFLAYGLTTQLAVHIMSWDVISSYVISGIMYILLGKIILSFSRDKDINRQQRNIKKIIVIAILACIIAVIGTIKYAKAYDKSWEESYYEYKDCYQDSVWCLDSEDEYDFKYTRLQFVNYFNPDGKTFTYEQLEESIENFEKGTGSWYTLWYCINFAGDVYSGDVLIPSFGDYGYDSNPMKGYWAYVSRHISLNMKDKDSEITKEQLDEACAYVYENIINQVPMEILGDEEEELVVNISMPENGKADDVTEFCESNKYFAHMGLWYMAETVGEDYQVGSEPVENLRSDTLYRTSITIYCDMPYAVCKEPKIRINGVDYEKIAIESEQNKVKVTMWITPYKTN